MILEGRYDIYDATAAAASSSFEIVFLLFRESRRWVFSSFCLLSRRVLPQSGQTFLTVRLRGFTQGWPLSEPWRSLELLFDQWRRFIFVLANRYVSQCCFITKLSLAMWAYNIIVHGCSIYQTWEIALFWASIACVEASVAALNLNGGPNVGRSSETASVILWITSFFSLRDVTLHLSDRNISLSVNTRRQKITLVNTRWL